MMGIAAPNEGGQKNTNQPPAPDEGVGFNRGHEMKGVESGNRGHLMRGVEVEPLHLISNDVRLARGPACARTSLQLSADREPRSRIVKMSPQDITAVRKHMSEAKLKAKDVAKIYGVGERLFFRPFVTGKLCISISSVSKSRISGGGCIGPQASYLDLLHSRPLWDPCDRKMTTCWGLGPPC